MLRVNSYCFILVMGFSFGACVTKQVDVNAPKEDQIDLAMRTQGQTFAECYEHNRARGKIVLEFTLDHLGHMTKAKVFSSTLKNPVADSCILQTLNAVKFPPQKSDALVVKYPLTVE